MKRMFLLIIIAALTVVSCKKPKEKELSVQQLQENHLIVNSLLLNEVDLLKRKISTNLQEDDKVFYLIYSFQKNDSNFLSISLELQPPYLLENRIGIGFTNIGNDYLLFFSEDSINVLNSFVNIDHLNIQWDKLGHIVMTRQASNHDTYYVYNDLMQLCYVLPPLAADANGSADAVNKYG